MSSMGKSMDMFEVFFFFKKRQTNIVDSLELQSNSPIGLEIEK